ncbi:MAG: sugar ABC transporter permease [Bacilli bacterium]|nr:sugar ABC transporter permease [Bacilli bacterium]
MSRKKFFSKDLIFYVVMLAFPVLQFCIFYIGVNGRSLLFAFQTVDQYNNATFDITALSNAFHQLFTKTMLIKIGNSFLAFLLTYSIGTTLALFFSYFIYKKLAGSALFKVFLFLPSIISSIILATIFHFFMEEAVPTISNQWFHNTISGLMSNPDTRFGVVIFYNVLMSFGTSVLMYSNAMSGLSNEIVEAAKIDGCNQFREFFHIVLPGIFPTITTFAITSVAAIFVNQLALYSLYPGGADASIQTIGYFLYIETLRAGDNQAQYPLLCAFGTLISLVAIPLTILTKFLLERFGPSDK